MPSRRILKRIKTKASIKELADVILNVDEYKNFVPHCIYSKVLDSREGFALAEVGVAFTKFRVSYISEIHYKFDGNKVVINVKESGNNLFKNLLNTWVLELGGDEVLVDFFVDFRFKNFFLNKVAIVSLPFVSEMILSAFISKVNSL